ncbi:NLP/P60 protein [Cellulophaga algicola DSM 14237]|uniref:NLP/P60 protein n=1 Tax=Cellulophaga algicola (strain DSM 14237 / IC166 / ACAM 630) TaxID=688270 RepID=E6XAN4_CELAD|nr:C40 family peptidase [Cellulophaga algicola]ADV50996.1 NLP/P60 protein [Cellulophaga algicola DSM 14237]
MKLKLMFLILIVQYTNGCKNTYKGVDQMYYKNQIDEARRLKEKEALVVKVPEKVATTQYLTYEEKEEFAKALKIPVEELENEKLYGKIKDWFGVPYLWGGTTKRGVDCSAFVQHVYEVVYDKELPRTSQQQFDANLDVAFKSQGILKNGDLIFFRLRHKEKVISHVGIYLQNGMFLGSNSPRGVEIANLKDAYWQDKYVSSARALLK